MTTQDKSYRMCSIIAEQGEEFTVPSVAENVEINYIECQDGEMIVRISYLVRSDSGGSVK